MAPIFHIAYAEHWRTALAAGSYRMSTRGRTLEEEGFIHCGYASQVLGVANAYYRGEPNLVLLVIDPQRLTGQLHVEPVAPASELPASHRDPSTSDSKSFPHVYGPLNLDAVTQVLPFEPNADGAFTLLPAAIRC